MHYELEYTGRCGNENRHPGRYTEPAAVVEEIWALCEGSDWGMEPQHIWVLGIGEYDGTPYREMILNADDFLALHAPKEEADHA